MLFKRAGEGRLGNCADYHVYTLTTLENHQRGDAADAILSGNAGVLVGIHFYDLYLSRVLLGNLIDYRSNHPAGATPRGPEIYQNGDIAIKNFLLKSGICNLCGC